MADRYPGDEDLRRMNAASYVGTALRASTGEVLGIVNAIHDRPLDEVVRPEGVLQVFAARAVAELERLRAEREIERQRVFADSLLDMVASLVIVVDPQGRIVRFNRACEQTSGWTEEELRGRALLGGAAPVETRAEAARRYRGDRAVLELPAAFEAEWQTRSGERRLISWINRPVFDAAGEVAYVLGTGTDVTDRRRLEADLRRAAFEWRETFDGLPLGVVVVDAEGRIVRANRTAVEHSGRASWSELIETPLAALGPGEPWAALGELARELGRGGAPAAREVSDPLTRLTWVVSARALAAEGEGAGRVGAELPGRHGDGAPEGAAAPERDDGGDRLDRGRRRARGPQPPLQHLGDARRLRVALRADRGLRALPLGPARRDRAPDDAHAGPPRLRAAEPARLRGVPDGGGGRGGGVGLHRPGAAQVGGDRLATDCGRVPACSPTGRA